MTHALALLTPSEMARVDRLMARTSPVQTLIDQAGAALYTRIRQHIAPCRTLILCGPGNNGADGHALAHRLARSGWPVTIAALAKPDPLWKGPIAPFTPDSSARADLVIDAVFGAGLSRDLDPLVIATLKAARRIVAVDVPTGLDGATGQPRGYAPQAEMTISFFRAKPGHYLLPGRDLCGRLLIADIGIPPSVLHEIPPTTWRNAPGLWTLPEPGAASHKYTRGHLTIIGGAAMTGAACLAASGARRAGAGLVSISPADPARADIYRTAAPGVIVDEAALPILLQDARRNVWLCGPGLGRAHAATILPTLLRSPHHVVADADAISPDTDLTGASILTPHAGEFTRSFGSLGPDKLAAVRQAALKTGAVIVLKGSDSIIAAPDGRAAINDSAPPWLATAGAGDVLAGIISALLAQGLPAWDAACAGVWLHGRAAALHGPGLIAEDIPPLLPRAFAEALG
jgi:hydroxyethylthiazole kinase-like uncharacterized protein yjeF